MIGEFTRRLKPEERRELEQQAARSSQVSIRRTFKRIAIWFLVLIVCMGLVAIVMQLPEPVASILAIVPNIVILVSLGVMVLLILGHRREARFERSWRKEVFLKLQLALADDTALVRTVQPNTVIKICQFEDEGDGYIFDVGSGKLLYLKGQWTGFDDESVPWPNTDFEIIRTSGDRLFIDIVCHGEKLEPVHTIDPSELVDYNAWEEHDELIEGELHAFADSLFHPSERPAKHPLD